MNTKLYVGNLPYPTTETDLRELFAQAGTVVSAVLIMDRDTGRSKGFGFVEMSNQVEAEAGIQKFNEFEFGGRLLKVSIARPREEGGGYGKRRGGGYGDRRRGGGNRKRRDDKRRY